MIKTMTNRNPKVDEWFKKYENPQKELVLAVRQVILDADERVTEDIKWQAPTFMYKGNIASFFPKAKKNVTLMFHKGASIPNSTGLLEGDSDVSRVARFTDAEDLQKKKADLETVIKNWIKLQD
jgi:hypothetical protein